MDEFLNTMHKRWLRQNEAEIDLAEGTPPNPKESKPKLPIITLPPAFAFLDTDHDGLVSVDEIAAQMQSVMRVQIPAEEFRSICRTTLSRNPKGLTMEDFKFLV